MRERSEGGRAVPFLALRGRGTDGGSVVDRSAAKYRHSAGPRQPHERASHIIEQKNIPVIMRSASALASAFSSRRPSTLA